MELRPEHPSPDQHAESVREETPAQEELRRYYEGEPVPARDTGIGRELRDIADALEESGMLWLEGMAARLRALADRQEAEHIDGSDHAS